MRRIRRRIRELAKGGRGEGGEKWGLGVGGRG